MEVSGGIHVEGEGDGVVVGEKRKLDSDSVVDDLPDCVMDPRPDKRQQGGVQGEGDEDYGGIVTTEGVGVPGQVAPSQHEDDMGDVVVAGAPPSGSKENSKEKRKMYRAARLNHAREEHLTACQMAHRAPRTRQELESLKPEEILRLGSEFDNRLELRLVEAELQERDGKKCTCSNGVRGPAGEMLRALPDRYCSGCAISTDCKYVCKANFQSSKGKWVVSKFHPHTCLEVLSVKAKSTSTAYSAEQLVRVVLPLIKRDPNITSTKVGEALFPSIVKLAPPKSLLHSVKNKALQVHNGDVNKQVGMLPALCAALSDEGHMTRVHYMDGRNMRLAIHDRLRCEHEFSQKNKAKVERGEFDEDAAAKAVQSIMDDEAYCVGWSWAPSSTRSTFGSFHALDGSDASQMRTEQRGCMLITATFDADRFSVPIAISCLFGSDNKAAWDLHHDFIDEAYGRDIFDTHDRRRIFDGEKDGIISARERLSKGGVFHSLKKRAASLSEGVRTGGSFAKDTFLKAAMAPTEAKVAEYKAKMAPDAMQQLESVPDTEQYMACSGYMQGESSEAAAEAFLLECEQALYMDMYNALRHLTILVQKRFYNSKKMAWSTSSVLPHSVYVMLQEEENKAEMCRVVNFPHDAMGDRSIAEVTSPGGVTYETNISAGTCMCGTPSITGLPDSHLIAHAKAVGRQIVTIMNPKNTMDGWRRQYPDTLEFHVPSESAIQMRKEVNKSLKLPPMLARSRGRPSKKKL